MAFRAPFRCIWTNSAIIMASNTFFWFFILECYKPSWTFGETFILIKESLIYIFFTRCALSWDVNASSTFIVTLLALSSVDISKETFSAIISAHVSLQKFIESFWGITCSALVRIFKRTALTCSSAGLANIPILVQTRWTFYITLFLIQSGMSLNIIAWQTFLWIIRLTSKARELASKSECKSCCNLIYFSSIWSIRNNLYRISSSFFKKVNSHLIKSEFEVIVATCFKISCKSTIHLDDSLLDWHTIRVQVNVRSALKGGRIDKIYL